MRRRIGLLFVAVILPMCLSAQSWKFYRHEFSAQLGVSNFLGELGGANREGTNGLRDLELNMTRPSFGLGYRYKISPYYALKASFVYGRLKGDDALTNEASRNNRNIHFRSALVEGAIINEFFFFKEKTGHLYRFKGVKGIKGGYVSPYVFAGIGVAYFNPRAQYTDGNWYDLKPLRTEGQGIIAGMEEYRNITLVIPYGIGVKYAVDKQWNVGLEFGLRKTFTDYMDDVSTNYYHENEIQAGQTDPNMGTIAAYFSDPSLDPNFRLGRVTNPYRDLGDTRWIYPQRGDPTDKDAYLFMMITVSYKMLKGRFNLPKF